MRQGQNPRRPRGRGPNGAGNGGSAPVPNGNYVAAPNTGRQSVPLRHQTFDSNGPEVRIRGSAAQVYEKYVTLARDASTSGDRIAAENYLQHAEHYFRIINALNEANAENQRQRPQQQPQPQQPQPQQPQQQGYHRPNGAVPGYGDQPYAGGQPDPALADESEDADDSRGNTLSV